MVSSNTWKISSGLTHYKERIEKAFAEVGALQEDRQTKLNKRRLAKKEKQA